VGKHNHRTTRTARRGGHGVAAPRFARSQPDLGTALRPHPCDARVAPTSGSIGASRRRDISGHARTGSTPSQHHAACTPTHCPGPLAHSHPDITNTSTQNTTNSTVILPRPTVKPCRKTTVIQSSGTVCAR
jgi:hypothetical protein